MAKQGLKTEMPAGYDLDERQWFTETVLPDPSTIEAMGTHHNLTTALADLVDNSIDATASHIRIRFVQRGTTILGIQIIDNGRGLTADGIKQAMTFGARREYGSDDLGHFGLGLKAASLSQASSFEIYSRQKWGPAVGRRMDQTVSQNFSVGVMEPGAANERLDGIVGFDLTSGTLVEWRGLKDVIHTSDQGELTEWRSAKLRSIREHLGITFHRHLRLGAVEIDIDTFDVERNMAIPPLQVDPIDPFEGSMQQGDYPRSFVVDLPDGASCTIEAHLFPPRLTSPAFDLYGEPGEARQGIYLYRRGRLLSCGQNWAGLRLPKKELGLGRIKIDLDASNEHYIALNPEKVTPIYSADFANAMVQAHTAGPSPVLLDSYFSDVQRAHRDSKKAKRQGIRLVEPSVGLNPTVLSRLTDLQDFADFDPIDLRFVTLPPTELFRANRTARRIDVNVELVRKIYGSEGRLSNRDAQLLKTFLYFLLESDFKVEQRWNAGREDRHRLLNDVLMAAFAEDFIEPHQQENQAHEKNGGD
ncbi:ATP-binding protein [Paenarthrobacter nitroguajacolicus]|uniref:ATP-binding protein n=1 Tax=Paenarthrobacter nitroguajacolicus TaxID=211146 RepID=UPI001111E5F0|nr:ATP-binding protein [Paenarthrobacter nitroguajacolicus]